MTSQTTTYGNVFELIGRRLMQCMPALAERIVKMEEEPLLRDVEDIKDLVAIYRELMPDDLRKNTRSKVLFTALCLSCFDPEYLAGRRSKVMYGLRKKIAFHLICKGPMVSEYIQQARVYRRAYCDFREDLELLLSATRARTSQTRLF